MSLGLEVAILPGLALAVAWIRRRLEETIDAQSSIGITVLFGISRSLFHLGVQA